MNIFLAILAVVLTLVLVVGIHEGGHALVARIFHVKIKKISLGFGKALLRWQTASGCEWVWAIVPLGGYVQLENTRIHPVAPKEYAGCFDKKPIWQRILILLAGAGANLITVWVALILVFTIGLSYTVPQIQSVQPVSPAAQAGIMAGDQFVSIAGHATPTWNDVGMELVIFCGKKEVSIVLSHTGSTELKEVKLDLSQIQFREVKGTLLKRLGIEPNLSAPKNILRFSSFGGVIKHTNAVMGKMLYFFLMIFKQLFLGIIPFSMLLGPLSLFTASIVSLTQGIAVFMFFIASLSLAVALVNLIPVPGLDGGSIVYALLEKVRGKPISVAMELLLHRLAFIIFCVLLVHLLMNDFQKY